MAKRRSRKLIEADRFHAAVVSLARVSHADWTDWEIDWLHDEARRQSDYIYTEAERGILNQLITCSKTFTHYGEYTIQELLGIAYPYRADFDEDAEEYLVQLNDWGAIDLKLRQVFRLAGLCRTIEDIGRDDLVDELMRAEREKRAPSERDMRPLSPAVFGIS